LAGTHAITVREGCTLKLVVPGGWESRGNVLSYYPSGQAAVQGRFDPKGAEIEIVGGRVENEALERTAIAELAEFGGGIGTIELKGGYPRVSAASPAMVVEYQELGIFALIRSRSVFLKTCGVNLSVRLRVYASRNESTRNGWYRIHDEVVRSIREDLQKVH
jgi:hypothetical protein